MSFKFSQRVQTLDESATLKMAQLARNLKAQGAKVISLTLGEPDFDTPAHIKESAKQALDAGFTKYTPVAGNSDLRQAVCTKLLRDNGLRYEESNIVVSNGAKQSFANLCMSLLEAGDEAIVFAPFWVSYQEIIQLAEAKCVPIYAGIEQNYKITADQLEAAINENTRLVIFSSPCNPTGAVYTRQDLEPIVEVLREYPDIVVISDEIYEYINFTEEGHISIASFEGMQDRTVIINGFSKGFSMTGWRLGYIAAPKAIADACIKIQGQNTSGASSFGQKAGVTALLSDLEPTRAMTAEFRRRRDLLLELLPQVAGFRCNVPEGAFYVFPDISYYFGKSDGQTTIRTAEDLALYLLYNAHVALVSGEAFGAPNCIRISYSVSQDDLREAVERMKTALEKLK